MANPPTLPDIADTAETARAIAQRAASRTRTIFAPTAGGGFTHATTLQSTTIPASLALGLTTAATSAALIAATTAMQDRVNQNTQLINRVAYILEANGMTS